MRFKATLSVLLLVSILAMTFTVFPVLSQGGPNGPRTDYLHIKNFGSPDKEFEALEATVLGTALPEDEIYIVDWPVSKHFIDRWVLGPDGLPGTGDELVYNGVDPWTDKIQLRDFTDLGIYMYDIYNQRWPTGVGDREEDVLTYDPDSMTEKAYFGDNQPWDDMAWMFRMAIRYLTYIDYIQTDILGGYGNMFDTQLAPLQEGWLDVVNLTASSFGLPFASGSYPEQILYHDANDNGKWKWDDENLYLDRDGDRTVGECDFRLNNPELVPALLTAPCHVQATDGDVGRELDTADRSHFMYHDVDDDNHYDETTENLYWDTNHDAHIGNCDIRLNNPEGATDQFGIPTQPKDQPKHVDAYVFHDGAGVNAGKYDPVQENLYEDEDDNGLVTVGDKRLTNPETPGEPAPADVDYGDADLGWTLTESGDSDVCLSLGSLEYWGIEVPSLIYPHTQDIAKAEEILDAAGFVKLGGESDDIRNDPRNPGHDLEPLIFYIRLDDPMRRAAGEKLGADLQSIGVPVDVRVVEKTVCFKSVMVEYNYHLYTGGYSIGFDPLLLYGVWHSSQYWGPDIGWSGGYQGFCNREYDPAAYDVMFGSDYDTVREGVKVSTYVHNKYAGTVPLYAYAGVHAVATGWEGVVNREGYGLAGDNPYTFWNMNQTGYNTIKWGFKANAEAFHVVCSEWVWDYWGVVDNTYDGILMRNPYNPSKKTGIIGVHEPGPDGKFETADDIRGWTTGMWGPGNELIYANITIRENAYFHDGTQVTPEDCKFSIDFLRACGPGVAWGYSGVIDVDHVDTWDYRAGGGDWGYCTYFKSGTYFALNFAGFQYLLNKKVWMAANEELGWGYDEGTNAFDPVDNRFKVREYHPWEHDKYNATLYLIDGVGAGPDGIVDIKQDGSGPWIYVDSDPLLMEWYDLEANRDWHLSQDHVSDYLAAAFHDVGDVDRSREVDVDDEDLVGRAMWTTPADGGTPGDWWAWNPDADLDQSGKVAVADGYIAGRGYGKSAGT